MPKIACSISLHWSKYIVVIQWNLIIDPQTQSKYGHKRFLLSLRLLWVLSLLHTTHSIDVDYWPLSLILNEPSVTCYHLVWMRVCWILKNAWLNEFRRLLAKNKNTHTQIILAEIENIIIKRASDADNEIFAQFFFSHLCCPLLIVIVADR